MNIKEIAEYVPRLETMRLTPDGNLVIGEKSHQLEAGNNIDCGSYFIDKSAFVGQEMRERGDVAVFSFDRSVVTTMGEIVSVSTIIQSAQPGFSGFLLVARRLGDGSVCQPQIVRVDNQSNEEQLVRLQRGDIYAWAADISEGERCQIVDWTRPPYKPEETEVLLTAETPGVPSALWQAYLDLFDLVGVDRPS